MNKFAAERTLVVQAMQKIASANGVPLTPAVAQDIVLRCQDSPIVLMKWAEDLPATMTPEEALQWQTYRANLVPNMAAGILPGVGPLIAAGVTPGWKGTIGHTLLPNLLGAVGGGALGLGIGSMLDPKSAPILGLLGAAGGGALGSYFGGRHYAPEGPATPDFWNNSLTLGSIAGAPVAMPLGIWAHSKLPAAAQFA